MPQKALWRLLTPSQKSSETSQKPSQNLFISYLLDQKSPLGHYQEGNLFHQMMSAQYLVRPRDSLVSRFDPESQLRARVGMEPRTCQFRVVALPYFSNFPKCRNF